MARNQPYLDRGESLFRRNALNGWRVSERNAREIADLVEELLEDTSVTRKTITSLSSADGYAVSLSRQPTKPEFHNLSTAEQGLGIFNRPRFGSEYWRKFLFLNGEPR